MGSLFFQRHGTRLRFFAILALAICGTILVRPVTLEELESDARLTPKRFANYFGDFRYEFHQDVQPPEIFLRNQAGDCDDYAILADRILKPKGYGTRLVCVRMPGMAAHAICYVDQEKGYLDYNNRVYWIKIEKSGPSLREIAVKVAKSFGANWTLASEFTFPEDGLKHLTQTISKTDPPGQENREGQKRSRVKIDF